MGQREAKFGPAAVPAVRSFSQRSPQILGIFAALFSGREICPRAKWRRERCWKPTVSAGRSEALGMIAETAFRRGLRSPSILCASQRLVLKCAGPTTSYTLITILLSRSKAICPCQNLLTDLRRPHRNRNGTVPCSTSVLGNRLGSEVYCYAAGPLLV